MISCNKCNTVGHCLSEMDGTTGVTCKKITNNGFHDYSSVTLGFWSIILTPVMISKHRYYTLLCLHRNTSSKYTMKHK